MRLDAKDITSTVIAMGAIVTALTQYLGKHEAQDERDLLIEQQNKIIERYEKNAERDAAIITFLDSIARTGG